MVAHRSAAAPLPEERPRAGELLPLQQGRAALSRDRHVRLRRPRAAQVRQGTRLRNEATQTFIRRFSETTDQEIEIILQTLSERAKRTLDQDGVDRADQSTQFEIDVRYQGQGLILTISVDVSSLSVSGKSLLDTVRLEFDEQHTQMFTFALPAEPEVVNLRAIAIGPDAEIGIPLIKSLSLHIHEETPNSRLLFINQSPAMVNM